MQLLLLFTSIIAIASVKAQSKHELNPLVSPRFQPRVIGGEEADPHQFPHQVALITDKNVFCSGSIIETNVILTAASCLHKDSPKKVKVIAGVHNKDKEEPTQQVVDSEDFLTHDDFNFFNMYDNIALVYLPKHLKLNSAVQKIALYTGSSDLINWEATVSGWGAHSSSNTLSSVLRYVTNTIITNEECKKHNKFVRNSNVCLSGSKGKSACFGDVGAPLHVVENNQLLLGGIVSFEKEKTCNNGNPTVFSRISSYALWIVTHKKK